MTDFTVEQRVTRLERQNRRLKLGMVAVMAVVAGLVCLAATEPAAKLVRAERFQVVDAQGVVRADLGVVAGAGTGLTLYDPNGGERAGLGVNSNGGTGLRLIDKAGRSRIGLAVDHSGNPKIAFLDEHERVIWLQPSEQAMPAPSR